MLFRVDGDKHIVPPKRPPHTMIRTYTTHNYARTVLQDRVHQRIAGAAAAAVLEEGLRTDGEEAGHEVEVLLHHVGVLLFVGFGVCFGVAL